VIRVGDGRATEQLVEAGRYGYAHSCMTSEVFPVRPMAPGERTLALLSFDRDVTAAEAIGEAQRRGLTRPVYEDAFYFGATYPDAQREGPIVFLHEPWLGYFGRWDVICLWTNAGRREIGLDGFEDRWRAGTRFAFVSATGNAARPD
jgi:hypothetical protein